MSSSHECLWTEVSQGVSQERVRKACLPCRRRKVGRRQAKLIQIRCAGPSNPDDEESTCPRCDRLSLVCSWATQRSSRARSMQVPHSAGSDRGLEAAVTVLDEHRSPVSREMVAQPRLTSQDVLNDKAELQQILRTYFGTVHCGLLSDGADKISAFCHTSTSRLCSGSSNAISIRGI